MSPRLTPICMQLLCRALLFALFLPACATSRYVSKPPTYNTQIKAEVKTEIPFDELKEENVLIWPVDGSSPELRLENKAAHTIKKRLLRTKHFKDILVLKDKGSQTPLPASKFPPLQHFKQGQHDLAFTQVANLSDAKFQLVSNLQLYPLRDKSLLKTNLKAELWDRTNNQLLWRGEGQTLTTQASAKKATQRIAKKLIASLGISKDAQFTSNEEVLRQKEVYHRYRHKAEALRKREASTMNIYNILMYIVAAPFVLAPPVALIHSASGGRAFDFLSDDMFGPGANLTLLGCLLAVAIGVPTVIAAPGSYYYYSTKHKELQRQYQQELLEAY